MNRSEVESDEDYSQEIHIDVDPGQTPIRIDKFLLERVERISRSRLQNAIRAGAVLVNGKEVKPNYKVRPLEAIKVVLPRPNIEQGSVQPEKMDLDIRYEDDDLLILHKPPGLVVHPGVANYSGTLVNGLAHYLNDPDIPVLDGNPANRAGLVHRIDKNTTGLLVIAKTDYAMTSLAKQFFDHTIEREYVALIWGEFDEEQGTISKNIGRHPKDRMRMTCFDEGGEDGKTAVTHYETIERLYYVSLVKCRLETGRTHQIRAHMQAEGHPIFNDDRYGGNRVVKGTVFSKYKQFVENSFKLIPRHCLHAKSLGFVHPTTKEKVFFDSELPDDFNDVLDKWRNYLKYRKDKL